jgi:hypothetical protein
VSSRPERESVDAAYHVVVDPRLERLVAEQDTLAEVMAVGSCAVTAPKGFPTAGIGQVCGLREGARDESRG